MTAPSTRSLIYVGLAGAAVFATLAVLAGPGAGQPHLPNPDLEDCRARYAAARTTAASMRVDVHFMRHGQVYSGKFSRHTGQCGELRYSGQLGLRVDEQPPIPHYTLDTAHVLGQPAPHPLAP